MAYPESLELDGHEVELAWALAGSARGRGIATAGGRAAALACFTEVGLERLIAFIDPTNAPSRAVADRLGFRISGSTAISDGNLVLDVLTLTPADLE